MFQIEVLELTLNLELTLKNWLRIQDPQEGHHAHRSSGSAYFGSGGNQIHNWGEKIYFDILKAKKQYF